MSWTLVLQILVLAIVGGFVVSGVSSDIIKAHAKGQAEVGTAIIKAQHEAREAVRASMKVEGLFDGK